MLKDFENMFRDFWLANQITMHINLCAKGEIKIE